VAKTGSEEGLRSSLTRRIGFRAEHRYYREDWSPEKNSRVFGRAANPEFHGHDYLCDVTVSGDVDESSGMLIDLAALDDVLRREVHERFDGRRVNVDVPEFRDGGLVPSCEVLARFIFETVQAALGGRAIVESVIVRESDTLSAELRRG
jgi:6-pyruvoyltetrahydropterin/6-carboxytetrahydropterin synthase